MKKGIVQLTENISYLPAGVSPLSSDVVFIRTDKAVWIFDTGLNDEAAEEIQKIKTKKNIVISHFHADHTFNLSRVSWDNLYVSGYTKKHVKSGTVINGVLEVNENPPLKIFELPSSHAKGCLCIQCGDFAFLGDGTYCRMLTGNHYYNVQLLQQEIKMLENLPCKYVCLDHDRHFIQDRLALINLHKEILATRKPKEALVCVEHFFDSNGKVKPVAELFYCVDFIKSDFCVLKEIRDEKGNSPEAIVLSGKEIHAGDSEQVKIIGVCILNDAEHVFLGTTADVPVNDYYELSQEQKKNLAEKYFPDCTQKKWLGWAESEKLLHNYSVN